MTASSSAPAAVAPANGGMYNLQPAGVTPLKILRAVTASPVLASVIRATDIGSTWLPDADDATPDVYNLLRSKGFRVYLAASAPNGPALRYLTTTHDLPVHASWLNHEGPIPDGIEGARFWQTCIAEAVTASALLLVLPSPEDRPRGALIEAGAALGAGVPVIMCGRCDDLTPSTTGSDIAFAKHPNWHVVADLHEGLTLAVEMAVLRMVGFRGAIRRDPTNPFAPR